MSDYVHEHCEECGKCRVTENEEWCLGCEYWSCERGDNCADIRKPE